VIRAVLTDIEGTTSSIAFVKDVLFPYARQHLPDFIRSNADRPEVRALLNEVLAEAGKGLDDEGLIRQLLLWIDEDRKSIPLKALQGMIWEAGYCNGDFTGHVYADAVDKMKEWHADDICLYIFSSGSVTAQKLLFSYSDCGDLTYLFSGYFDTRMGSKRETASYRNILSVIHMPGSDVLFLSDMAEELNAAHEAGLHSMQLVREGTIPVSGHAHAENFSQIDLGML
jgi:2,3-diketo-5-methylthio-1-phosphopentane phosphatase